MERKVYLLKYFQEYMARTLEREVEWSYVDHGRTKNMDFLVKYYRMKNAIVFKLSNDVLQVRDLFSRFSIKLADILSRSTSLITIRFS